MRKLEMARGLAVAGIVSRLLFLTGNRVDSKTATLEVSLVDKNVYSCTSTEKYRKASGSGTSIYCKVVRCLFHSRFQDGG